MSPQPLDSAEHMQDAIRERYRALTKASAPGLGMQLQMRGFCALQVGFFEIVAMPLLKSMAAAFPGVHIMLDAANQNYMMWRAESVKST